MATVNSFSRFNSLTHKYSCWSNIQSFRITLTSFCCRGKYIYEAFLHSEIVLSAFDGSPLAALAILEKKICDHPLLSTKRAAEDVLEGMESTLTPEEAGVAERLAMHIADNVDTDDFQTKNDSISCKLSFIMSLLVRSEIVLKSVRFCRS
ncbi:hypothetical protein YC2023_050130 [Brassica napus]